MIEIWPDDKDPLKAVLPQGTVAIIMPVRGQIKFAQLAYYSIRSFTDLPYMFVFINNMSDLKTKKTLAGISMNHQAWLLNRHAPFDKGALVNHGLRFCFQNKHVSHGVVIDSDIVVGPGWLSRLVSFLNLHPRNGIVSPSMNNKPSPRFGEMTGSCMVFRRETYEDVGGFPEGVEHEDIEFCKIAQSKDWRVSYLEDVYVHHFGGITRKAEEKAVESIQELRTSKEGCYESRIKVG